MTTARKRRLSRIQRLSSPTDFQRVYAAGESKPGRYLVIWRSCRGTDGPARVGVVASKRSIGKAHDRNRAKRLMREAFRGNKELFADGIDYVLIARSHIKDARLQAVAEDLVKAFERLDDND